MDLNCDLVNQYLTTVLIILFLNQETVNQVEILVKSSNHVLKFGFINKEISK